MLLFNRLRDISILTLGLVATDIVSPLAGLEQPIPKMNKYLYWLDKRTIKIASVRVFLCVQYVYVGLVSFSFAFNLFSFVSVCSRLCASSYNIIYFFSHARKQFIYQILVWFYPVRSPFLKIHRELRQHDEVQPRKC